MMTVYNEKSLIILSQTNVNILQKYNVMQAKFASRVCVCVWAWKTC